MFRSAVVLAAAAFVSCVPLLAQRLLHPPAAPPSFEVATIKPSPGDASGLSIRSSAGFVQTQHTSLRDLIRFAWDLKSDDQLESAPEWAGTEYFDLQAKADDAERKVFAGLTVGDRSNENRWMLQALLGDRFHLRASIKTKTLPVYLLTVAKGGPKPALAETKASTTGWHLSGRDGHLTAQEVSMPQFADWLTRLPETGKRIVIDRTGLKGVYDLKLDDYSPSDEDPGASVFSALHAQLGLRLKAGKAPVEVLVIEHVERPSAN